MFNYTDHLGNIRVSYGKDPATNVLKILEENHYYPFGLKHKNYNSDKLAYVKEEEVFKLKPINTIPPTYKYKYNGKELQDELGLNMYDYGARNYMADLGRWGNVDPKAENSRRWTPYNYAYNNPMRFIDPDGMQAIWQPDRNGNLVAEKGDNKATLAKFLGVKESDIKLTHTSQNNNNIDFKEGDVVTLDNNMTRSIEASSKTEELTTETDTYYNCHGAASTVVKGEEINQETTGQKSFLTEKDNTMGEVDKEFKSNLTEIKSSDQAVMGKTVLAIGSEHSAVFYGKDNKGTEYYYSKNGFNKPAVYTKQELLNIYSSNVKSTDIKLLNYNEKK